MDQRKVIKLLASSLLVTLFIVSTWLFINVDIDYQFHQTRIEQVRKIQQEVSDLVSNTLLVENGGRHHFDDIAVNQQLIKKMLRNLHEAEDKTVFINAVNQTLNTVTQIKSTYAIYRNSLLYFPKNVAALRSELSNAQFDNVTMRLNELERDVTQLVITNSEEQSKNILNAQIDAVRMAENHLPKQFSLSIEQLLRHTSVLVEYSIQLKTLNKQLLKNDVNTQAQLLLENYYYDLQQDINQADTVRERFYLTIFLLIFAVSYIWWKQQQAKEELIQEKILADNANKAKSEFLSSMSHELRTPLNAILGFSQLLEGDEKVPLSNDQRTYMRYIADGGKHLLSLINQVLELSAIEAGKTELSIEPIHLTQSIENAIQLTSSIAKEAEITLHVATGPQVFINADVTKLQQIILNLLSNAIKYNNPGGSVTIAWTTINDDFIRVTISDTGIGIAKHNHHRVFDAFNRLGQETSTIEGAGIGLLVTKNLLKLMNGRIGFDSAKDKGSTFWFELPIAETDMDINAEINEPSATKFFNIDRNSLITKPKNILYVEDNVANRDMMQSYFRNWPSQINLQMAESAEIALQKLEETSFDLILMDIHLPGQSGKDLTLSLRSQPEFNNIPIIAITAAAMKNDITNLADLFDVYITKPVDFVLLTEVLKKYLAEQRD